MIWKVMKVISRICENILHNLYFLGQFFHFIYGILFYFIFFILFLNITRISVQIWLKDAVQCRDCGMVCHKKCETRCQASSTCGAESLATLALEADEIEPNAIIGDISSPEISLTGCEDNVQVLKT